MVNRKPFFKTKMGGRGNFASTSAKWTYQTKYLLLCGTFINTVYDKQFWLSFSPCYAFKILVHEAILKICS